MRAGPEWVGNRRLVQEARTIYDPGLRVQLEANSLLPEWFALLTASTESAATGPSRHRLRFVHGQPSSTELVLVKLGDGALCACGVAHLDKRKPTRLASRSIANDVDRAHLTGGREEDLKIGFGGFVRQVADVQLRVHELLLHFSMQRI
jgi:hypothetical protein